ncbi:hypothetical protein BT96DRAFT_1093326 [Gymnopus androsaceus JB14]|uniref:Uncharacterized protein n=1 Tax=Gymnopus androsaceus JB14 TaxID=1447944 RepID=A0A6A4HSS9_9AGAR|nr:hypothetical protein BT96DRAFT_1093326 [Gymnopus androsaceus JB14]
MKEVSAWFNTLNWFFEWLWVQLTPGLGLAAVYKTIVVEILAHTITVLAEAIQTISNDRGGLKGKLQCGLCILIVVFKGIYFRTLFKGPEMSKALDHLQKLTEQEMKITIAGTSAKADQIYEKVTWVFPLPSNTFTGRRVLVEEVKSKLAKGGQIIALIGPGGSEKTQIALKVVEGIVSIEPMLFHYKFFIDASTQDGLKSTFKSISKFFGISETMQDVLCWLSSQRHKWLLVFGNVDDGALGLRNYIPQNYIQGSVIITNHNSGLRTLAPECFYSIAELEEEDAIELLLKYSGLQNNENHHASASKIADKLGCLALAVSTAGSYILQSFCTLEDYLVQFEEHQLEFMRQATSEVGSYNHTLCSFLHYTNIPIEIFSKAAENLNQDTVLPGEDEIIPNIAQSVKSFLGQHLTSSGWWDSFKFGILLNEIASYSLLSIQVGGKNALLLRFHSLFHQCAKDIIYFPVQFHQDAQRAVWKEVGNFQQAQVLSIRIFEKTQKLLGKQHPDTLHAMGNLASTYC